MTLQPWLLGVLGVVAVVHTVAIVAALRRSVGPAPAADQPDGDAVACAECDTENEPGYRYCRTCVAELPGPAAPPQAGARGSGGRHSN